MTSTEYAAYMARQQAPSKPRAKRFTGARSRKKQQAIAEASLLLPRQYHFVAHVEPMGAPRMTRRDTWAKRPCVVSYHAFRDAIRAAAGTMPPASRVESISVNACFYDSANEHEEGEAYRQKPDWDNIFKGVTDAIWKDDQKLGDVGPSGRYWTKRPSYIEVEIYAVGPHEVVSQTKEA
jgi:Holliday junction resolvase RusA-like endonuclease